MATHPVTGWVARSGTVPAQKGTTMPKFTVTMTTGETRPGLVLIGSDNGDGVHLHFVEGTELVYLSAEDIKAIERETE